MFEKIDNIREGIYGPIPESYSQQMKLLVASMLNTDPA